MIFDAVFPRSSGSRGSGHGSRVSRPGHSRIYVDSASAVEQEEKEKGSVLLTDAGMAGSHPGGERHNRPTGSFHSVAARGSVGSGNAAARAGTRKKRKPIVSCDLFC